MKQCDFCYAKSADCAYGGLRGSQSCIDLQERYNKSSLKFDWKYDRRLQSFVFGVSNHGGGVFLDLLLKGVLGESWHGNSVVSQSDTINSFGPYRTKLEAQLAVEQDFIERTTKES